ncbi:MAG TPA: hypothetical protein VMU12_01665 [Candidatus Paceibacterota bacterium]|nr:hypothetical protein [Candidatus Paceibacterota bacterium]
MKYIFPTILVLSLFLMPLCAHADSLSYDEAWVFHYAISFSYNGSTTTGSDYSIIGGDAMLPNPGAWTIEVDDAAGSALSRTQFEPSVGAQTVEVPYQNRGFSARIVDDRGTTQSIIDLSGSRVCNDDGVCNADLGENTDNCPTDCGAVNANRQAAIANQSSGLPGGLLLVLADILVIGLVLVVDRRRRA